MSGSKHDFELEVAGGVERPYDFKFEVMGESLPDDPLLAEIMRLKYLHPKKLEIKFREGDLEGMDEPTKKALLEDFRSLLGIEPILKDWI